MLSILCLSPQETPWQPEHYLHSVIMGWLFGRFVRSVTKSFSAQSQIESPGGAEHTQTIKSMTHKSENVPVSANMKDKVDACDKLVLFYISVLIFSNPRLLFDCAAAHFHHALFVCPFLVNIPLPVPYLFYGSYILLSLLLSHYFNHFPSSPFSPIHSTTATSVPPQTLFFLAYHFILLSSPLIPFFITSYPFASPPNAALSPGIGFSSMVTVRKARNYR